MKKITVCLKMAIFILLCFAFFAFTSTDLLNEQAIFVQKMLVAHYDGGQEAYGLKRGELVVTNTGFCRYKRYFENGKIEYFSFNLIKFKDLDYLGTVRAGKLLLHTMSDDVIVQTYNDKKGDLDSMASSLTIPLKNIEPEDLADFSKSFLLMHAALKK
ncbi:MAG: hypothetical protein JWQ28_2750 [Pedobacter sp.]|jgi:hypothetical protein|nr:hypothetical protein [Pedobacter sp.]